jgi:uncharacterized protein YcbK (DUF882 family)
MNDERVSTRRGFLRHGARIAAAGALPALAAPARASLPGARGLALVHTHTHEQIELVYAVGDRYFPDALGTLNRFLRDHYTGDVGLIDPKVFDQLCSVQRLLGAAGSFEVISGYRCPATNSLLRATRGGGVASGSLHMQGRAIDVRLPGVALADLRDAALSLHAGGVGFYASEQFVHLDTGAVRRW